MKNTMKQDTQTVEEKSHSEEWGAWRFVSEMLSTPNPDPELARAGIYNTSKCYEQIHDFVAEQKRKAFEEGVKAERQFILNVLDGIDIADGECNTKAIRKCLEARYVCRDNGPSFATEEENDWFVSIGAPRRCNQCKLEGNHGVCDKKDCKNYPKNKQLTS